MLKRTRLVRFPSSAAASSNLHVNSATRKLSSALASSYSCQQTFQVTNNSNNIISSKILVSRRFNSSSNNKKGKNKIEIDEEQVELERQKLEQELQEQLEREEKELEGVIGKKSMEELETSQEEEDAAEEAKKPKLQGEKAEEAEDDAAMRRYKLYAALFLLTAGAAYAANEYAKWRLDWGKKPDSTYVNVNTRGRPSLGGPFVLVDHDGNIVSQADFLGKWVFFYFGFVHCPEICPIELNRMTKVVDAVREQRPNDQIQPLFVSCDVKRDSLSAIKEYLSIFHKDFIGLVGTPNQINNTCKSYRIYYSLPDEAGEESGDYLIDHSIAIFLFDPKGRFVDFFGSRFDHNEITVKVREYMDKFEADPDWTNY